MFERQNFRLILNDLDKYNEILNKFILKYLKLKSIRCNGMGGGHSSRRTAISFSFRIDLSRVSVVSSRPRGGGGGRKGGVGGESAFLHCRPFFHRL